MEYTLNGKISLDDYIQFNKNHQKHGFSRVFRIILYSALFIFIGFTFISNKEPLTDIFKTSPLYFIEMFIPLIVILIIIILLNKFGAPLILRPIYKRHYKANKMLQQTQNIKINEQCISITTETGNVNLTKENINKIIYDKDSIYIYTALNMAHILKKHFLENENDFDELVKFIKFNYNKK
jgi:multisubunit Na+/H+ antiporter MnhG subunit